MFFALSCATVLTFGQYSDSTIATVVVQSQKFNPGVSNPDSIKTEQLLYFLVPVLSKFGDTEWGIISKIGSALTRNDEPVVLSSLENESGITTPTISFPPEVKDYDHFLWIMGLFFIVLLGIAAFLIYRLREKNKYLLEHDESMQNELNELDGKLTKTERELEESKGKEQIFPPVTGVDEKWLEENNPEGKSISDDEPEEIVENFSRVYGKKPDFIVRAKVTTRGKGTNLGYSFGRTAVTTLNNVTAFIAWDKVGETLQELGFIIGSCANRFQTNPEEVRKISDMFEFNLDGTEHPIVFKNSNISEDDVYPELVKKLVVKHHDANITDLRKAGVQVVIDPAPLAPVKAKKSSKKTTK